MKELRSKIQEALISALPITVIVYLLSLLPWFDFTATELITFTIGAVLLILGIVGLVVTYAYNRVVVNVLFPHYKEEQFLAMYGMLTGTASTGIILLREIDGDFKTPVSDNLVYQNFPAIIFGFPIMLLATLAPVKPLLPQSSRIFPKFPLWERGSRSGRMVKIRL